MSVWELMPSQVWDTGRVLDAASPASGSRRLRVAVLVFGFPLVSETFVVRQIADLLDVGHDVRIFASERPRSGDPIHPDVSRLDLLSRVTYVEMPEASRYELPALPLLGKTWVPGQTLPVRNVSRIVG